MLAVNRRIKALIAALIIAVPLATAWASNYNYQWPDVNVVVHLSLVFTEAGLLGLWAAFGQSRLWPRSLCIGSGLICLSISILIAHDGRWWLDNLRVENLLETGFVVNAPALLAFFVLRILRRSSGLRLVASPPLQPALEGFQFSIKHLMVVTALVAAILSLGNGGHIWFNFVVIVAVVELATLWAALGLRSPLPRLMIVLPCGFVVGIVPPSFMMMRGDWRDVAFWSGITGFQAIITAATLLVFRSCGWRLCFEPGDNLRTIGTGPGNIEASVPLKTSHSPGRRAITISVGSNKLDRNSRSICTKPAFSTSDWTTTGRQPPRRYAAQLLGIKGLFQGRAFV